MLSDFRYALRTLRKSPAFVAVAVACLALGVGVNTSVFSMVNALVIRALPFPEPDRVVMLYTSRPAHGIEERGLSAAEVDDLRRESRALGQVGGQFGGGFNIAGEHETERVDGEYVTHDMLPMVGVRPALGRFFLPEEDRPGAAKVVILSHDLWARRFDARPSVVGDKVVLNGAPHTVVGVMPPGFRFPLTQQLWVPAAADPAGPRANRTLWTIARLRPGATVAQAHDEARALGRRLAAQYPASNAGWEFNVKPINQEFPEGPLRVMLAVMLGSASFVVLIVCANLANLMLARGAGRSRELAVRSALGASRARLMRQLLVESVALSVAGGALGVLVAWWWNDRMLRSIPEELPYWVRIDIDPAVLAYTLGLSVVTGIVFGTLPALRAARPDLQGALKAGGRAGVGRERARLRSGLVVAQVALAVVLLVGAGLMVKTFVALRLADTGVDSDHLLTLRTHLSGERYDRVSARAEFYARLAGRLQALPGVRHAAATTALPSDGTVGASLVVEGRPVEPGAELMVTIVGDTPGTLDALGAPLVAGRGFTAREAADTAAAVAVVNRALAERLWPGESALARRVRLGIGGDSVAVTVVGVAPDVDYADPMGRSPEDLLQVRLPYGRLGYRGMSVVARVSRGGDPAALAAAARRELRAMDATLPAFDVRTMDEVRAHAMWPYRLYGESFATFGGLALVLAAVGVYGVIAYGVAQRRHEIGVRMALGARAVTVARDIVRGAVRLAVPGAAIGLAGAFALSRVMRGVLYGVSTTDLATFVGVPITIVAVALFASWLPARRAARVDPATALRAE